MLRQGPMPKGSIDGWAEDYEHRRPGGPLGVIGPRPSCKQQPSLTLEPEPASSRAYFEGEGPNERYVLQGSSPYWAR